MSFYRNILILLSVIVPSLSVVVNIFHPELERPLWARIIVPSSPVLLLILSYRIRWIQVHIRKIYLYAIFCITPIFIYLIYLNDFFNVYFFSVFLLIVIASVSIKTIKELFSYIVILVIVDLICIAWKINSENFEEFLPELAYFHSYATISFFLGYFLIYSRIKHLTEILRLDRLRKISQRESSDIQAAIQEFSAISITDLSGSILYVNDLYCKIVGTSREELIGKTESIFDSKHHPAIFFASIQKVLDEGKMWRGDVRIKNLKNEIRWIDRTVIPLFDDSETPARFLSISNDITDRKMQSFELERSEEKHRKLYNILRDDLRIAAETQRYLLPNFNSVSGLNCSYSMNPLLEVSGDLLSVKKNRDGSFDFLLADVVGHGTSAALLTAVVSLAFRWVGDDHESNPVPVDKLFESIRDTIYGINMEQFICGVVIRWSPKTKELIYSYAGHFPGILYRDNQLYVLDGTGTPIYSGGNIRVSEYSIQLKSSDKVLFFTDGAYELLRDGSIFLGYDEFIEQLKEIFALNNLNYLEAIQEYIFDYTKGNLNDDFTLFYFEVE
ncbi:SpoIIE family protein phosphatase [Leptospira sp. GIMC2001]|uniref:SpoIIE family protein phosphatase n=1 Tax=Leptospira sp. GIMC2001 TaxID=1513297 RepID=UPI0023499420|nr:SpoIIE family protein phosphatase [Leptospira sp. GIMC2001]WCL50418.1 SpoIIE family protein phosphatase [Leptospira sp. GIMC2001]